MLKWLKKVFHCHEWKTINTEKWERKYVNGPTRQYTKHTQQCKVCGKIQSIET